MGVSLSTIMWKAHKLPFRYVSTVGNTLPHYDKNYYKNYIYRLAADIGPLVEMFVRQLNA